MDIIVKLVIVLMFGFVGGRVARRMKLPAVSGYLLAGLLLGPSWGLIFKGFDGLINVDDQNSLLIISEIALCFIAFSIGSEFDIKNIKKNGKAIITLTTAEVIGAVFGVFFLTLFLPKPDDFQKLFSLSGYTPFAKPNIAFSLILASMSASTAPAATLLVVRQYRAYGSVTRALLPITALDDIYGIVIFGFCISIAQTLTPGAIVDLPLALMISKPFIEVFGSLLVGGVIGFILATLAKMYDRERDDIQVLAISAAILSIGLFKSFSFLDKYGISLSPLLSNIVAGSMVTNLTRRPDRTFNALNDFSSPFFIVFFTMAGASLDLNILKTSGLVAVISLVYILARGFGKYLGIYFGAIIAKSDNNIKKYLGLALLPQGGVSIGLLVIVATSMKTMYPLISTIIMLSILVYETSGPIFAKIAISKSNEINGLDKLQELSNIE